MSECADIREVATCVAANILSSLEQSGVLLYAKHSVYLCKAVQPYADETVGFIGPSSVQRQAIMPTPKIDMRAQFRNINNIVTKVGDAKFDLIPQNLYTKAELEGADYWEIDGEKWNLVDGTVRDDPTSVFWSGVLAKVRESDPLVMV